MSVPGGDDLRVFQLLEFELEVVGGQLRYVQALVDPPLPIDRAANLKLRVPIPQQVGFERLDVGEREH